MPKVMNNYREAVQEVRDFNNGYKKLLALKYFDKYLDELTEQERLDLEDIIRENNK
jgi:hypothetical protein